MKRFRWLVAAVMAIALWSVLIFAVFAYARWLAPLL